MQLPTTGIRREGPVISRYPALLRGQYRRHGNAFFSSTLRAGIDFLYVIVNAGVIGYKELEISVGLVCHDV